MKKIKLLLCLLFICSYSLVFAQEKDFNVYDPTADAQMQIRKAIAEASESNKHILLEIGGNWCKWCRMFYKFSNTTPVIDSLLKADYVVVHINFSKENKNPEVMKQLEYPQRFGFPVFVVLDEKGNRIHTQNSAYLEEGEGYGVKKVEEFLKQWNFAATSDSSYP